MGLRIRMFGRDLIAGHARTCEPSTDAQLRISNCQLRDELSEAKQIMTAFVRETDDWNDAIAKIIGRPPNYCWNTLERARKFVGK